MGIFLHKFSREYIYIKESYTSTNVYFFSLKKTNVYFFLKKQTNIILVSIVFYLYNRMEYFVKLIRGFIIRERL